MDKVLSVFVFLFFISSTACAQQLVYKPTNPAFGGDTFNHNWLMSSAQAQNDYQEEELRPGAPSETDELSNLNDALNGQFVNQLSNNIFSSTFGEEGLQPGVYNFGNLNINVVPSTQGLSVKILDVVTGETTTVIVPYF